MNAAKAQGKAETGFRPNEVLGSGNAAAAVAQREGPSWGG